MGVNTDSHKQRGLFGLKSCLEEASIVCLPVPWDVTASYGGGASLGPELVLEASSQIDFFDEDQGAIYKRGIFMLPIDKQMQKDNLLYRKKALPLMEKWDENSPLSLGTSGPSHSSYRPSLPADTPQDSNTGRAFNEAPPLGKAHEICCSEIDTACSQVHERVYQTAKELLERQKLCCLLGGDHSTALGLIQAVGEKYRGDFSLLQLDAHADLRPSYQGFKYSHASIMFRVLEGGAFSPRNLLQVGIRDFSEEEWDYIGNHKKRIDCFSNQHLQRELFQGKSWEALCEGMVKKLHSNVYVSFDVDVLKPYLCPQTGTPVPGGLELEQVFFLLHKVHQSGRHIVGFDVCEVSPGSGSNSEEVKAWNGNVGSRILYKLCGWINGISSTRLKFYK